MINNKKIMEAQILLVTALMNKMQLTSYYVVAGVIHVGAVAATAEIV